MTPRVLQNRKSKAFYRISHEGRVSYEEPGILNGKRVKIVGNIIESHYPFDGSAYLIWNGRVYPEDKWSGSKVADALRNPRFIGE